MRRARGPRLLLTLGSAGTTVNARDPQPVDEPVDTAVDRPPDPWTTRGGTWEEPGEDTPERRTGGRLTWDDGPPRAVEEK
ncbi:hypothetical protein GCM10012276_32900 [Nocardioides deserti]|nr:hypothetical protein GCM10012276_32900 [Nocardioides deserti]